MRYKYVRLVIVHLSSIVKSIKKEDESMWMERMYFGTDHMIGQDDYMPYLKDKFEIRLYNVNSSELASF